MIRQSTAANPGLFCNLMVCLLNIRRPQETRAVCCSVLSSFLWRAEDAVPVKVAQTEAPMNPPTRWQTEKTNPKHNKSPVTVSPTAPCSARRHQAHITLSFISTGTRCCASSMFYCDKEIFSLKPAIIPFPLGPSLFF